MDTGFLVGGRTLEPWSSIVSAKGLSCSGARGILVPRPGTKPMSPVLQGDKASYLLDDQLSPKGIFFVLLVIPDSQWDLSSPNRNQTHVPCNRSAES